MLAEVVEAERQIMLWERKIQLEKETQAALDPHAGSDVVGRCAVCSPRTTLALPRLVSAIEATI